MEPSKMLSDDSDDELLANLLATANDDCSQPNNPKPIGQLETNIPATTKQSTPAELKELDFNFLDDITSDFDDKALKIENKSQKTGKDSSLLNDHANSSDDEDQKYFEKQQYSDYGRQIKNSLKNKELENQSFNSYKIKNGFNSPSSSTNSTMEKNKSLSKSFKTTAPKNDKYSLKIPENTSNIAKKLDVYSDKHFGLRIINPLVSSAELSQRMEEKKAVTISNIERHLSSQLSDDNSSIDWVVAGVLIQKSLPKTSQKGSQYIIWKLSDLTMDMKTISVFLFAGAYKQFWKVDTGAVVGILNPSLLESRGDSLATLSVDIAQKIMVFGYSKDLGKCKSLKKNGQPCSSPINTSQGDYCVYHVKKEYNKFSKRVELQTLQPRRAFGYGKNTEKDNKVSQYNRPGGPEFVAIPAKRNEALYKKDCELMARLKRGVSEKEKTLKQPATANQQKKKFMTYDLSVHQRCQDLERLKTLQKFTKDETEASSLNNNGKKELKSNVSGFNLENGAKGGFIDFSEPIPNRAKLNAIEWVKKNGVIQKTNPNRIRPNKEVLLEKGIKRKRDDEEGEKIAEEMAKKQIIAKSRFQKILEMQSSHADLVEHRENEETEKYFNKLEAKERMEEKMLTTFKVNCKAVTCSVCKYMAFSSSDMCKKLQHPIKVIDAIKRFFKCLDCGNRTVSLHRIPTETCSRCSSSKWVKTCMMDEKKTLIAKSLLCIRGDEEKFMGSAIKNANLDLLVPESDENC